MNYRNSGIIIEFLGAPGIGKTYLAKELSDHLESRGASVNNQSIDVGRMPKLRRIIFKIRLVLPSLIIMPGMLKELIKFILLSGVRKPTLAAKMLLNWLYIIALIRQQFKMNRIIILDQGIAQALWSVIFRGYSIELSEVVILTKRILKTCGAQQLLVVYLIVDQEIHRERLLSRRHGNSPLDNGDLSQFKRSLEVASFVRGMIGKVACEMSTASKCCVVDFEGDGEQDANYLNQKLEDLLLQSQQS